MKKLRLRELKYLAHRPTVAAIKLRAVWLQSHGSVDWIPWKVMSLRVAGSKSAQSFLEIIFTWASQFVGEIVGKFTDSGQ